MFVVAVIVLSCLDTFEPSVLDHTFGRVIVSRVSTYVFSPFEGSVAVSQGGDFYYQVVASTCGQPFEACGGAWGACFYLRLGRGLWSLFSSEARFIIVAPCFSHDGLHDCRLFGVSVHQCKTPQSLSLVRCPKDLWYEDS
jgi:hypothetical protein